MHLSIQYLDLRKHYREIDLGVRVPVTVDQLAGIFFCTKRNVKIIIKKLTDAGWIHWCSGRGRGNMSVLTFLHPTEALLLEAAQEEMQRGELQAALALIEDYGEGSQIKDQFMEWLNGYFGYNTLQKQTQDYELFRFPVYQQIYTLDPAKLSHAFDGHMARQIYDTLVMFNRQTQSIEPHLAHHWEVSADATTWHFFLRRGIMFHHGRELNSADVVYSLQRMREQCSGSAALWFSKMKVVEALDSTTIRIQLTQPNHLLLRYLCNGTASILPMDLLKLGEEEFFRKPTGTGPFKLTRWTEHRCVLESHPQYFLGRAHLDGVEIVFLPEDEKVHVDSPDWNSILCYGKTCRKHEPHWNQIEEICTGSSMLQFNQKRKGSPVQDLRFRKAIHHLIDRKKMVQELSGFRVMPAHSLYPRNQTAAVNLDDPFHDSLIARALLKDMEYDGTPVKLACNSKNRKDTSFIRDQCAAYGIPVEIVYTDDCHSSFSSTISSADLLYSSLVLEEDQVTIIETYYDKKYWVGCNDVLAREINQIIQMVLMEAKDGKRQVLLDSIETKLMEFCALTFITHSKINTAFHPSVKGLGFNSLGWMDFRHIWIQPDLVRAKRAERLG
ncbi:hypothetical protein SY83_17545 [Paenibacillus swuensis]|uniref:ABC transporter substrate-binding protein n=1 Tax=Paenibacillus swuensis TaxID=1178515 RepID=A0A172TL49_9BACL|nr:ABC transporter substrate-binding protein [Paenibacillus swuensis]ANE47789.1 hypothetical protein SY83_17545 [Paenibacillus swuensis]